ncbi:signal peptide peptidase SppA [Candidatus Woesearchaeota archaeon]|nr:signal peptide peptidase SppA [Candidatus Woesearchaeota archaeon]
MAKKKVKKPMGLWQVTKTIFKVISFGFSILAFIIFLLIFASVLAMFVPHGDLLDGNIAVIPITGVITTGDSQMFTTDVAKSSDIISMIEKAEEKDGIKAILLEIDSPGGAPVATDEIAQAVKDAEKPTVAVIRETGASGAYWISTAADKIFANRMSITGSIGVRASNLGFAGLMQDYNVTYRRLVAGKYKDAGSPYKEMTPEEKALFQGLVDDLHEEFITAVARNRNLPVEKVRELATGFVFLGSEAKELGLVDELGNKKDALKYLEKELGIEADPVVYEKKKTFIDMLGEMKNSFTPESLLKNDIRASFT